MAARTAADAVGARECLKMGGETKVLGISGLAARTRTACVQGGGWKWVG